MQKIHSSFFLLIASLTLASCGTVTSSSGPVPLGPDTWRISVKDGIKGFGPSQALAITEANRYCLSLSKNILVIGTKDVIPLTSEVTFRCLKTGDPELVRPNLQPAPNSTIRIENR